MNHPPGIKIYEDPENNIAVFEVDGKTDAPYTENLSLLSRLFLRDKNIMEPARSFDYYVLCEKTSNGVYHVAGYFSKLKSHVCLQQFYKYSFEMII